MSAFERWLRQDEMAVAVPPHDFPKFLRTSLSQFKELEQAMTGMIQNIEQVAKWVQEFAGRNESEVVEETSTQLPNVMRRAIKDLGLDHVNVYNYPISHYIQNYFDASERGWVKDIHDALKYQEKMMPYPVDRSEYKQWTQAYFEYRKTLPDIHASMAYIRDEDYDDEYLPTKEVLVSSMQKLNTQLDATYRYCQLYFKFTPKIQASNERMNMAMSAYYNSEKKMPTHKPVEYLYHASINVPAILRDGMKTRAQVGISAAGGGPDDVISTTADLSVAKAIVDGIHEIVQIARGQMSYQDIRKRVDTEFPPSHIDGLIQKGHLSAHPLAQTDRDYEADRQKGFTNHEGERYHVLQAYKMYLMTHPHRYDPLFWGVRLDDFAKVDERAVGILALKTDMSKVKEYLSSMEEFRIPVEAIISMKQVPYVSMYQRTT